MNEQVEPKRGRDPEIQAMERINRILDDLPHPEAALRVLEWATRRWQEEAVAEMRHELTDHPLRPRNPTDPGRVPMTPKA